MPKLIKILLFIVAVLLVLMIVAGISFWVTTNIPEFRAKTSKSLADFSVSPGPLQTYKLPLFVKKTLDVKPHSLRLKFSLAYEKNYLLQRELEQREDEIQHVINILLQGKKYEELDSADDAVALAESIKAHINVRLNSGRIKEVYYKEFVVE